jgi:shikimate dehydrogenase
MIRLGLIGKNISHSLSPEIYKEILKVPFIYDLIDCEDENSLPELDKLREKYTGINITSPYKKYYLKSNKELINLDKFDAINCLKFTNNKTEACNTDSLACDEIWRELNRKHKFINFVILGDGAMAELIARIYTKYQVKFTQFNRKNYPGNFNEIDLSKIRGSTLVVNSCGREYLFKGKLNQETVFWDLNYRMPNIEKISSICLSYLDGYSLLRKQAIHAASFWGLALKAQ